MGITKDAMTRRDLFKAGALMGMAAVGSGMVGCATQTTKAVAAEPFNDTSKAATGIASASLAEATSDNVLNIEISDLTINEIQGIVYKTINETNATTNLKLDLLLPSAGEGETLPLVVFVNGGGFTKSNPQGNIVHRMAFAKAGYAVASVQHRVVPTVKFPEPLLDVKAAVRWLKANADTYKIDKSHVAAVGNSSGGYFATMLGVTGDIADFDKGDNTSEDSKVNAVIDLYGVSDLTIIGAGLPEEIEQGHHSPATTEAMLVNGTAFGNNKGASVFDTPDTAAPASPFTYIDGTDPAFLILHGDKDTLVSPVASMELYKRLTEAGVEADRYVIAGASHGGPLFNQPQVVDIMVDFLDKHLKA